MSLIAAYTFNESGSHDFSGNKYHLSNSGVGYIATTSTNGGFGMDAVFNADDPQLYRTSFPSFAALTGFTCFFNWAPVNHDYTMCSVSGAFQIILTGTNHIQFKVTDSTAATHTLTSTGTLTLSTWATVGCVWDGTALYIYINGALDSSLSTTFTNMGTGSGGLTIGGNIMHANINCIEFHNRALSLSDIAIANTAPGGTLVTGTMHNFATGDLICDSTVTSQAVVTWINDGISYYVYPFTAIGLFEFVKVGNVYNTARQNLMELVNDFDGNGSGQIRVKYPIASFADYASPLSTITLDHDGLSGSASNIANMMAITSLRI